MLLELIATCVLGAGVVYTPPAGWTLTQVKFSGVQQICNHNGFGGTCLAIMPTVINENSVTLRRAIAVGETVEAPPGCTLSSARKE